jgi:KaiC/GvpD/RAD55 family RecA-like ATPase
MIYALLPSPWLKEEDTNSMPIQGNYTTDQLLDYNARGYNIYWYPNYSKLVTNPKSWFKDADIDTFEWVYVDMDLKEKKWNSKEHFLEFVVSQPLTPTQIVDSGNGIHVYWKIEGLDAKSFLQINRKLARLYLSDLAVGKIKQLMRLPNTINTKDKQNPKLCSILFEDLTKTYTAEEFAKSLPPLSLEDKLYCDTHFNRAYNLEDSSYKVDDKLPAKFGQLLLKNAEVNNIWAGKVEDRSESDFRLGYILHANGFDTTEAMSVLTKTAKALTRAQQHRLSYATNIVDKIWVKEPVGEMKFLSESVSDILKSPTYASKGTRFPCWRYLDATVNGFRLGQVVGLVAGSGVGKTAVALNMFMGFVTNNPDYEHFYVPLEQPKNEIAERWKTMCGTNLALHDKVHVLSNYEDNGEFRALSFSQIREYILRFQEVTGKKVGSVVIDHIGALKKQSKDGRQSIEDICHEMKGFAIETNTLLIMQSQAPREKADIGDIELDKSAAYGTVFFESYVDYLITVWQPLKRCYGEEGCPTVTAFKFCKIRHKKQGADEILEDKCYSLLFDPKTERLRKLNQYEEKGMEFWVSQATNKRRANKKTDIVTYHSAPWGVDDVK